MGKLLIRIQKIGVLWSTLGLILVVVLQIFARFFLEKAPPWTEELSRIFFIYSVAFAAGLALKDNYFVHLDYFFEKFSKPWKQRILLLIPLLSTGLFILMIIGALSVVELGQYEWAASLPIRMSWVFLSILILALFLLYHSAVQFIALFNSQKKNHDQ